MIHHDPLTQFDLALLDWLHAHATPAGYRIFDAISLLGSPVFMGALAVVVAAVLAVRRQWLVLGGWAAALVGVGALGSLLKYVIRRPRPQFAAAYLNDSTFSFPSGHAMGSLVGYGMLAYVLVAFWVRNPRARLSIVAAVVALVVAIGISRLYLGVHYFSDVVGGYAVGIVWLSGCVTGVEIARRQPAS